MNKSTVSIGGIIGVVIIVFVVLFSFQNIEISTPELIVSNGHGATTVGETISGTKTSNL